MEWQELGRDDHFPIHTFTIPQLAGLFEAHGLRVVRILGKPVFFSRLKAKVRGQILADEALTRRLLKLEIRYADDPGRAGLGTHIKVTGVKI